MENGVEKHHLPKYSAEFLALRTMHLGHEVTVGKQMKYHMLCCELFRTVLWNAAVMLKWVGLFSAACTRYMETGRLPWRLQGASAFSGKQTSRGGQ